MSGLPSLTGLTWKSICFAWLAALLLWFVVWLAQALDLRGGAEAQRVFAREGALASHAMSHDAVDSISLRSGDQLLFACTRRNGAWMQTHPVEFEIEAPFVAEFIERVDALEALPPSGAGVDGAAAGAIEEDAPRLEVCAGGKRMEVALGSRLPGGCAWVSFSGPESAPRVARATLHDAVFGAEFRRWRQLRLFTRADVECDRITSEATAADGSSQRLELERRGRAWWLASPVATRADREAVERWLDALGRARANGCVVDQPRDLAPFGLIAPAASIEIASSTRVVEPTGEVRVKPAVEKLEIGSPVRAGASEHFARLASRPDVVLEIDAAAVAASMPPALSLVDGTATGVRGADIRALRLEPVDAPSARLERAGALWTLTSNGRARPASVAAVERLLSRICTDRATDIAKGGAPAELLIGTIAVEGFDGRDLATIRISHERDGGRFGVDDGSGILRIYPSSATILLEAEDYDDRAGEPGAVAPPVPLPR
jgi:hypothetical protein